MKTAEELRTQYQMENGDPWENSQGEPDIDYVMWLEKKLLNHPTLNRDKVMEILTSKAMSSLDEIVDALCSLSLPTLSHGEIRDLVKFANEFVKQNTPPTLSENDKEKLFLTHCHATDLLGASVMDYNGFKDALKELTKKE
jgi:hypothetical protein